MTKNKYENVHKDKILRKTTCANTIFTPYIFPAISTQKLKKSPAFPLIFEIPPMREFPPKSEHWCSMIRYGRINNAHL